MMWNSFYDAHKPLYIEVDTSKKGIGSVMLKEDAIVRNDSKSGNKIPADLRPHMQVTLFQQQSQIIPT